MSYTSSKNDFLMFSILSFSFCFLYDGEGCTRGSSLGFMVCLAYLLPLTVVKSTVLTDISCVLFGSISGSYKLKAGSLWGLLNFNLSLYNCSYLDFLLSCAASL